MEPNILDADLPVTGNPRIDHWLAIAGALVPMCSMLAGRLNQQIRDAKDAGEEVSEGMLKFAQIVNLVAVNLDKSKQIGKLLGDMRAAKKALSAAPAAPVAPPGPVPAGPPPAEPPKVG
jgi:hypothetical protein